MLAAEPDDSGNDPFQEVPDASLRLFGRSRQRVRWLRVGDLLLACALLALTLPLMATVAFAVMLESEGPVLTKTRRWIGGGRSIGVLRFRTTPPAAYVGWVVSDGAPTRLGRFLHSTRIDELPQLLNVLRGEMSFFDTDRLRTDLFR